ncbi:MAG: hypothetical protein ABFS45_21445 [Pseudomonadota bacterium]
MDKNHDSAASNKDQSAERDSGRTHHCPYCLEIIKFGQRKCPYCGSPQGIYAILTIGVKWTAGLLTVLTLALGVRQLAILAGDLFEQHADIELRVVAAERLVEAGEYESAWNILLPVAATTDTTVRRTRLAVARGWLLHAHAVEGRTTFLDITGKVAPVIAGAVAEGTPRERAETTALFGYTQFLRSRVEVTQVDLADYYRQALAIDPDCALAHLFLGSFLAGWADEFKLGMTHLQRALELSRSGQIQDLSVRQRQLQAIINRMYSNPYIPNPSYNEGVMAFVRVLNDIRRDGEVLPDPLVTLDRTRRNRYLAEAKSIYRQQPGDENYTDPLRQSIPLNEHVALLHWLQAQTDEDPDQWLTAWLAYFQEQVGDAAGAVASYRQVTDPNWRLAAVWDAAMLRLTGQPYRPLSQRDPWDYRLQVLGSTKPSSKEFRQALNKLEEYMDAHRLGARYADAEALQAAQAAFDNLTAHANPGELDDEWEVGALLRTGLALGQLLITAERPNEALPVLKNLADDSGPAHELRGEVLLAQAVAHAQHSKSENGGPRDIDIAVEHIREAIDHAGYADWARIRWFDDLRPIRAHPDFTALLREHGRTAGGLFVGPNQNGR